MAPTGRIWILTNVSNGSSWSSGILYSDDDGATIVTAETVSNGRLFDLALIGSSTMVAVGQNGTCVCSTNGGVSWQEHDNGLGGLLLSVTFTDALSGWVVGNEVYHTSDGGQLWSSQNAPSHPLLYKTCFLNSDTAWIVGVHGTILHTSNGGAEWQDESFPTPRTLYDVCFLSSVNGWTVGGSGLVLHYAEPESTYPAAPGIVRDFTLTAFPNPFNASTTIAYALPRAGHVSLRVLDPLGREVAVLADEQYQAGEHRVTLDGAELPSGIYFARLSAGTVDLTQKLMLIR